MPLIRQPINALFGGVSQQAAVVRNAMQCERAVNCWFTVAKGASKRPPLETLMEITSAQWGDAMFDFISHPDGTRYLLVIPGTGKLDVYRLSDGNKLNGTGLLADSPYLQCTGSPREAFKVYTVGNLTYILNTEKVVAKSAEKSTGVIGGSAQSLADDVLNGASDGFIYKILGDATMPTMGYYAKKVSGRWIEWCKPDIDIALDNATMPHGLKLLPDAVDPFGMTWDFAPQEWEKLTVGDEKSNAFPSFTGRTISSIFFASDRLGFLSENNVILSEIGVEHHRNFFRSTVIDMLDSDRIDRTVASDGVTSLRWAMPIAKSIITSSDERQFSLDYQNVLSPRTLNINEAMAYPASGNTDPVAAGQNVYWITGTGEHASLLEMFVQEMQLTTDANDVSGHVPHYVPLPVTKMAAHTNTDALFMLTGKTSERDRIYVYKFHWNGDQKVQSAWNYWHFNECKLLTMGVVGDHLYVVYQALAPGSEDDWKTYLGRINLKSGDPGLALGRGFTHPIYLDHLWLATPQWNAAEGRTYFSCPFDITSPERMARLVLVKTNEWGASQTGRIMMNGSPYTFTVSGPNTFYVNQQFTGKVLMGLKYAQEFTFSEQFYEVNDRSQLNARLQLRNMSVSFHETGAFKTSVKIRGIPAQIGQVVPDVELVSAYSSRTLGDEYFTLGRPNLQSGIYRFPVYGGSNDVEITLLNDTYLPSNFLTAEWEGLVTTRTR